MTMTPSLEPPVIEFARYHFKSNGVDFDHWMNKCLGAPDHYLYRGEDFFGMAWKQEPDREYKVDDTFWLVFYLYTRNGYRLDNFFRMLPYELPYIGFMRGLRGKKGLKYYQWKDLNRLCNSLTR